MSLWVLGTDMLTLWLRGQETIAARVATPAATRRDDHHYRQPCALMIRSVEAGYCWSFSAGRIGLLTSSPPQFGHMPCKIWVAQLRQKVHSKEQIMASAECGGRSVLQHSQFGRN